MKVLIKSLPKAYYLSKEVFNFHLESCLNAFLSF